MDADNRYRVGSLLRWMAGSYWIVCKVDLVMHEVTLFSPQAGRVAPFGLNVVSQWVTDDLMQVMVY